MRTGQPRPLAPGTDGAAGGTPKPYEFQTVGRERSSKFLFHNYSGTKKYKPLPGGGERVPPEAFLSVVEANDPVDPSATAFCASQTGTNGEQPPPPSLLAGARWTGTRCRSLCVSVCCCR